MGFARLFFVYTHRWHTLAQCCSWLILHNLMVPSPYPRHPQLPSFRWISRMCFVLEFSPRPSPCRLAESTVAPHFSCSRAPMQLAKSTCILAALLGAVLCNLRRPTQLHCGAAGLAPLSIRTAFLRCWVSSRCARSKLSLFTFLSFCRPGDASREEFAEIPPSARSSSTCHVR